MSGDVHVTWQTPVSLAGFLHEEVSLSGQGAAGCSREVSSQPHLTPQAALDLFPPSPSPLPLLFLPLLPLSLPLIPSSIGRLTEELALVRHEKEKQLRQTETKMESHLREREEQHSQEKVKVCEKGRRGGGGRSGEKDALSFCVAAGAGQ